MASTRHPRSRTGCWICRLRKKKCDEARPICQQCRGLRIRCDGYGIAQPVWMRDPEAAKKKKEEIKLQIGKRGRRRKKTPVQIVKDFTPKNGIEGKIVQQHEAGGGDGNKDDTLEDDISTKASEEPDDDERRVDGTQPFTFEMIEGGIQLLEPFDEASERSSSQAIAMLDSPHPPIGCFRCPIKDSFAKSAHPISGYELLDASTGKPLIQGIKSEAVLVDTLQLWKSPKHMNPSSRTKEEEIDHDEYDAIIASFTSLSTSQTPFGLSEISDPSLIPPIKPHELNLVKNFIRNVFRLTYRGMSESMIHRSLREVVVPMLCTNPGFLKGCMSSSAMHLALSSGQPGLDVKTLLLDALNHAIDCIHDLNTRLVDEGASEKTLASILILTSSEVPSSSSNWKPHLTAAIECLVQMDLLNRPTHSAITKFLMTRVIWLDIISALTLGRAPQLWANYREILSRPLHERSYCGLLEMMGCDDTVMLLVSEVMCVEDYKFRTLDDGIISWRRGRERAMKLDVRLRDRDLPIAVKLPPSPEPPFQPLPSLSHEDKNSKDGTNNYLISLSPTLDSQSPVSDEDSSYNSSPTPPSPILAAAIMPPLTTSESTAAIFREETTLDPVNFPGDNYIPFEISPDQGMVIKATSAAFRTATRIHLWSIGLGFYPRLSFFQQLLEELVIMITLVPIRLNRIVAWPLLVGGCIAIEPKDREYFASRCTMGDGSLCGIAQIMKEVWKRSDENDIKLGVGCGKEVHWRSVMREQDMEILLV